MQAARRVPTVLALLVAFSVNTLCIIVNFGSWKSACQRILREKDTLRKIPFKRCLQGKKNTVVLVRYLGLIFALDLGGCIRVLYRGVEYSFSLFRANLRGHAVGFMWCVEASPYSSFHLAAGRSDKTANQALAHRIPTHDVR